MSGQIGMMFTTRNTQPLATQPLATQPLATQTLATQTLATQTLATNTHLLRNTGQRQIKDYELKRVILCMDLYDLMAAESCGSCRG